MIRIKKNQLNQTQAVWKLYVTLNIEWGGRECKYKNEGYGEHSMQSLM